MPRVSGPTISRWRLGEELRNLRQEAGLTFAVVAEDLGCSESKIRKIESGDVGVGKAEFERLLELYKVDPDDDLRHALADLQKLGKQRGWWAQYGSVPSHWANYLALESEATSLRIFEPMIVHGLLQTDEYASALDEAITGGTPAEMDRFLRIRTDRKKHVWESNDPPRIWVILDEASLRRMVGGPDVMRAQLYHLLKMKELCTLQVVPFNAGAHPGALGAFTIFDFDEEQHSPVVYVEGQAGNLYLERSSDLDRCNLAYSYLTASALSPSETTGLISAIIREMAAHEERQG